MDQLVGEGGVCCEEKLQIHANLIRLMKIYTERSG